MPYENGKIIRKDGYGISIADIQKALVSGKNDIGSLCISPNINMWNLNKPEAAGDWGSVTAAQRAANFFGIDRHEMGSPANVALRMRDEDVSNVWTKKATAAPYRMLDFDGYDVYAKPCFASGTVSESASKVHTVKLPIRSASEAPITLSNYSQALGSGYYFYLAIQLKDKGIPASFAYQYQVASLSGSVSATEIKYDWQMPTDSAFYVGRTLSYFWFLGNPTTGKYIPLPCGVLDHTILYSDFILWNLDLTLNVNNRSNEMGSLAFYYEAADEQSRIEGRSVGVTLSQNQTSTSANHKISWPDKKIRLRIVRLASFTNKYITVWSYNGQTIVAKQKFGSSGTIISADLDYNAYWQSTNPNKTQFTVNITDN